MTEVPGKVVRMAVPSVVSSRRTPPCAFCRVRFRLQVRLQILVLALLLAMAGCGSAGTPAMKVVDGFFDAVANEDPAGLRALLNETDRQDFEAAMSDAELTDYLAAANAALAAQYGSGWRKRITLVSATPEQTGANGIPWTVTVSLGEAAEDRQTVPVVEREGAFWLDLSWVASQE